MQNVTYRRYLTGIYVRVVRSWWRVTRLGPGLWVWVLILPFARLNNVLINHTQMAVVHVFWVVIRSK